MFQYALLSGGLTCKDCQLVVTKMAVSVKTMLVNSGDGGLVVRLTTWNRGSLARIPPRPSDFSEQKIRPHVAPLHPGV